MIGRGQDMTRRHRRELVAPDRKHCIGGHDKSAGLPANERSEGFVDFAFVFGVRDRELHTLYGCCSLYGFDNPRCS